MKKLYLLLMFFVMLSGCKQNNQSFNSFLQSWIGKSQAELVETWGAPVDMETITPQHQVLTYIKQSSEKNDFGVNLTYYCQIKFDTQNNIISDYSVSGTGCPK